jgi:cellulose biosynthesis protein BcsQ
MGIHTLVADLDPQANATKTLMLTKSQQEDTVYSIKKTLMVGVQEKDLTDLPVKIMDNLDLIPSYIDFQDFTKYLYQNTNNAYEETHLLEPLFNPLKKKYDVILLDVPPFSIEITRNAVIFSDFALISLQTHDDSLSGAEEYVNTLSKLQQEYQLDIEVIGILPMLHDARNGVDQTIIQSAKDEFGEENVFTNIVTQMARIKRFPINGITDKDRFDKRVLDKYQQVTDELLSRIGLFIDDKEAK